MATKTAQIIIEVDDKSLVELNSEIKQLETSIGKLAVGTKEWVQQNQKLGTLKNQFQSATKEAQKLQGTVQDLGSAERIRSVAKLGAGLVGSFSALSGSVKLLGGTGEAFDEMTAKAATLMSIMGGLNQVSELFSKGTMTGLKSLGSGFGTLVRTVKTASLGMKTALISTGIGALVVGVGLLIANFDKLVNLVTGKNKKELEGAKAAAKAAEEQVKLTAEATKQKKNELDAQYKINNGKTEEYNKAKKNYELGKLAIDDKIAEQEANKANLRALQVEYGQLSKRQKLKNEGRALEIKQEAELNVAKQKTLETDLELLQTEQSQLNVTLMAADAYDATTASIEKLQNQLTVLNSEQFKSQQIYEKQLAIINQQIKQIKLLVDENGNISKSDKDRVAALEAQRTALDNQNKLRIKELGIDIQLVELDNLRSKSIFTYNAAIQSAYQRTQEALNDEKNLNVIYEDRKKLMEMVNEGLLDGKQVRDDIVNFDLKRNEILEDRLKRLYPSEAKVTTELYNEIRRFVDAYKDFGGLQIKVNDDLSFQVNSVDDMGKAMEAMYETTRKDLELQAGLTKEYDKRSRMGKQIIDDATQQLILVKIQSQAEIKSLEDKKNSLIAQREESRNLVTTNEELLLTLEKEFELQVKRVNSLENQAKALKGVVGKEEEYYAVLQLIDKAQQDLLGLDQEANQIYNDIVAQKQTDKELTQEITDTEYKRVEAVAAVATEQEKVGNEMENQLRLSEKLQDFVGKYSEEIQVAQQLLAQSIEFIASLQDRKAKKAQERIDDYQDQLDDLSDEEEDRQERLADYEEELKDANGERYDELLSLIQTEKDAQILADNDKENSRAAIEAKIKDENNKKLAAEARAAKWRKAQAIIDAVIQGALGVIKALPNIFLAVATGVLAAAGIATIAAQKTPPIPEGYAEGGYTGTGGKNEVAGVVHRGEYVAPQYVVNSAEGQAHISALEAQRMRGYADGGFVAPNLGAAGQSMIDYDRMAVAFYGAVKGLPTPEVSVVKISQAQNEVQLTKQQAGLTR